jgi:hypothetical protein
VRDFQYAGQGLVNKEGKQITATEWMNGFLAKGYHGNIISETFPKRKCLPLFKPLLDDNALRDMGSDPDYSKLRP